MADYPYMSSPATVKEFLTKIQSLGVPDKVTTKYLESLGFKSKNDRALIGIIKAIGFIDASGIPTQRWKSYRSTATAKATMAAALRETYGTLFKTYPQAQQTDNEALRNFFSSHSNVGEGALRFMVGTFKSLTELADFGADAPPAEEEEMEEERGPESKVIKVLKKTTGGGMTVNINIQLTLPASDDGTIYEKFFAAMKKNLFPDSE